MLNVNPRAILDMKTQRDKLHQYQKRITLITDRETSIAKACLEHGDRKKALLALRRKKFQESLLAKTDKQLETLEQLVSNVEFSLVQKDVVFGLQQGTSVLKQIHAEMGGLEQVEKLMGESEEAREYQREIGEMLRGEMSTQDEEEVEEELDRLHGEIPSQWEAEENPTVERVVKEEVVLQNEYPAVPGNEPVYADELKHKAKAKQMAKERKAALAMEPVLG
ncbi:MAG: hypothetical protein Q9164_000725 [Protoblastenia rupestris]